MSVPLESLDDFLGETVTQELPRSFMVRPALTLNEESVQPPSKFANWRRGVATRYAIWRQKMREAQQRNAAQKSSNTSAPLQSEVDDLKSELDALRNEMRMMKGNFKVKKGSDGSSGGDTIETATSDPPGFGLPIVVPETADSDGEGEGRTMVHTLTQSGFHDDCFLGWSGNDLPALIRDNSDSDEEPVVRSYDLTPMAKVKSTTSQAGFGDDGFEGW